MATKLELVAKVINGLGLTWTDEVVGQSFNAIESAIAGYVSRIRKYFLAEGTITTSCLLISFRYAVFPI